MYEYDEHSCSNRGAGKSFSKYIQLSEPYVIELELSLKLNRAFHFISRLQDMFHHSVASSELLLDFTVGGMPYIINKNIRKQKLKWEEISNAKCSFRDNPTKKTHSA